MRITTQNLLNIKPQLADFLSNLKVGDTVKGRLAEMLGESISIKTASGQVFTAALTKSAELKLGQIIELNIQSITEDGIFAEIKPDAKQTVVNEDSKLQQLIKQMDIKPEENNLQAAKLLLKYNMPVTKENIVSLATIQKSMESLAQGDSSKAIALLQSKLNISNTEVTKLVKMAAVLEPQSQQISQMMLSDDLVMPVEMEQPQKAEAQKAEKEVPGAQMQMQVSKASEDNPKAVLQKVAAQIDEEIMKQEMPKVGKLIDTIATVFEAVAKAKPEQTAYMFSKDMKVTPAAIKALIDHTAGENKLAGQLEGLEELVEHLERAQVDVKELKQELKKLFVKPEQLQDKEQVTDNFKEIVKLAGKLETIIKEQGLENKVDNTVLQDVKSSMDFMRSIHANINYIQIPLQINENKTTADIYVFNDKKRGKTINPENATILIALDLNKLGHLESLIIVAKRNVNITFKVEHEGLKKVINGEAESLKLALEARGYQLSPLKLIDIREKFNLMELEAMTSTDFSQLHVDIKV